MKKTHCRFHCVFVSLVVLILIPLLPVDALPVLQAGDHFKRDVVLSNPNSPFINEMGAEGQANPNLSVETQTLWDGTQLQKFTINSPPHPPDGRSEEGLPPDQIPASAHLLPDFPAYRWVFGCSAVSAAMIAAYYDRNGYPEIYTGLTNGGVMPISDTGWGTWSDDYDTYPNNPLVASREGVDGYLGNGSIEDYWVLYGSTADDPYITGGWDARWHSAEAAGRVKTFDKL